VAHVGNPVGIQQVGGHPVMDRSGLVCDVLQDVHAELPGPGADHLVAFGGQNQLGNPGAAQPGDSHAVPAADADELFAVGVHQCVVVGVDAVEVHHQGVHVHAAGKGCGGLVGQCADHVQVLQRVDFDGVRGGDFLQFQPAEEAVPALPETL